MTTTATNLHRTSSEDKIPDGEYRGIWSGYTVTFDVNGVEYAARTQDGIRGLLVACAVTVNNTTGTITVFSAD